MRNFKDIIIEKLKVTKNYSEFTWDEFINALYKYDDHHDLWFEDLPNINGYDENTDFLSFTAKHKEVYEYEI